MILIRRPIVADAAVALAVLIARRHLLAATLLAAAASAAVSAAVAQDALNRWALQEGIIDGNFLVGLGPWPGTGEIVGMAVLPATVGRSWSWSWAPPPKKVATTPLGLSSIGGSPNRDAKHAPVPTMPTCRNSRPTAHFVDPRSSDL